MCCALLKFNVDDGSIHFDVKVSRTNADLISSTSFGMDRRDRNTNGTPQTAFAAVVSRLVRRKSRRTKNNNNDDDRTDSQR